MRRTRIVVVGAGVSGLTVALELSKNPANSITVVAKHMPGDLAAEYASPWAGATFFPFSERGLRAQQWEAESWSEFCRLASSVPRSGVGFTSASIYTGIDDHSTDWFLQPNTRKPWFVDVLPNYNISFSSSSLPPDVATSISFTGVCINPDIYLVYLASQCREASVVLERGEIDQVCEAASLHHSGSLADILVNCTGLLASRLGGVEDSNVFPVRGQFVVVGNASDHMISMLNTGVTEETDIIVPRPAGGGTFLGGSYNANDWNPHPDPKLANQIMKRCIDLHPYLTCGRGVEGLSAIRHGVGFRPARTGGVRCEVEEVKGTKVIHNYGHGGSGYQASYGCAYLVVKFVQQIVDSSKD